MGIYKCFKSDFEDLTKKINRITKKLDKNGLIWKFEVISETIEEIEVIDYRNLNNIPLWQFTPKSLGKRPCEIVNYLFEMESLKLGDFEVLAVIEHNVIGDNDNIIHIIKENTSIPLQYRTAKSICQHCNSDRQRNKTVLLKNTLGEFIQVGTSCIKEYTGIDGIDIIRNYQDINTICLKEIFADYEKMESNKNFYTKTIDYLSACIELIYTVGYKKEEDATKYKALEIHTPEQKYKDLAKNVINYFINKEFAEYDTFLNNIKTYLKNEYVKNVNGFVAYAYLAYQKEIEKEQKIMEENANKKPSEFVGNIGEKIEKELIYKKHFSFETQWGTSCIYIFEDLEGNIYKWNSSKWLDKNEGEQIKLKGTIKDHEEYKDQKQTVLTRCKEV